VPGVGAGEGEAAARVPEHPGGQVDADGGPAELAELSGVDAGPAADLQADAAAVAKKVTQDGAEAAGVAVLRPGVRGAQELVFVPVGDLVVSGGRA